MNSEKENKFSYGICKELIFGVLEYLNEKCVYNLFLNKRSDHARVKEFQRFLVICRTHVVW